MHSLARNFCLILCFIGATAFAERAAKPPPSRDEAKVDAEIFKTRMKYKKTSSPLRTEEARKLVEKFPRWRKNKKYRKAMVNDDKIWVVAKTRDSEHPDFKEELSIAGAGMTTASKPVAYRVLQDFDGWTELGEYVHRSRFNKEKKELYLHLKALGYYAKMFLDVQFHESGEHSDLYMKVVRGHFLGMVVAFRILKDAKSRKTEILMTAVHPFETLPLPRSFIEFGLEIVFQHIGQKLRQRMQAGVLTASSSSL